MARSAVCSDKFLENEFGQPIGWPVRIDLPRPRPDHRRLQGHWGYLEPLTPDHAPALFQAFLPNPAGFTYMPNGPYTDPAEFQRFIDASAQSRDPLFYAICTPDGTPLGHATFLRIDPAQGVIEVGFIHYGPALQRTALATETMYLMMAHVFDDLGYRRYEWKCDALNAPSRRAAKRLGFTFEGIFRQATTYKGRNRDTAWFSILDREWPAAKAEFTRWLAPSNFDADGSQLSPLAIAAVP
jgi:RimJ/RimL family protein N-acetyltransferase